MAGGPAPPGGPFISPPQAAAARRTLSSDSPYPTMAEGAEAFDFEAWATQHKLSRKTTAGLRKDECTTLETLKLATAEDVNRMDVAVGQIRILRQALGALGNPIKVVDEKRQDLPQQVDHQADDVQAEAVLAEAGRELEDLVGADPLRLGEEDEPETGTGNLLPTGASEGARGIGAPPPTMGTRGLCDPLMLLTVKSTTTKALQIINYLPESVRSRVNRKRREHVSLASLADGGFTLKTDNSAAYYVTFEEWSAANMRLAAHLLKLGQLTPSRVVYYMAYTAMMSDLATQYEWSSCLEYDTRYRELQAEHGFDWGTQHAHTERHILAPKRQNSWKGVGGDKVKTAPLCRQFLAYGACRFGKSCDFRHESATGAKPKPKDPVAPAKNE